MVVSKHLMEVVDYIRIQPNFFCLSGSRKLTKTALGSMFVAADVQLFKVDVSAFITKRKRTYMAAVLRMQFLAHTGLKVASKPMVNMGSLERR